MYQCRNRNVKILNELPMKGKIISYKNMVGMSLDIEYFGQIYKNVEIIEYVGGDNPKFKIKYKGILEENPIQCGNLLSGQFARIFNKIYIKTPWMIDLGVSEEDAKRYTYCSNKKITVKCPNCGKEKKSLISNIYKNKSIGCICGDGFSYPEKFMYSILTQLGVEFETQYSPDYLIPPEGKRYRKYSDFYLPKYKIIIETDGALGHEGGRDVMCRNGIKERISTDNWKDEQHKLHGIETIRIDCFESDMEYIKNNILKSKLNEMFNLSNVDWEQADLYAIKSNKVKEVCDYWNDKNKWSKLDCLSREFKVSIRTVINYLNDGAKLGWCNYFPKSKRKKKNNSVNKNQKIKTQIRNVEIFDEFGNSLGIFESCSELERQSERLFGIKLNNRNISAVCNNKQKHHKGYTFRYINKIEN